MIELHKSERPDVPELQELFFLCFGDSPACSGLYFDRFYRPEEFLVLREEGALRAMAGLLNISLTEPDGRRVKAAYLYAVGVHPEHRGKGFAGQLLHYADFYLHGKRDCLVTMPAGAHLHAFYKKFGFAEAFPLLEGEAVPRPVREGERARSIGGEEYDELRETLLSGRHHASYGSLSSWQQSLCEYSGGALLALDVCGVPGCAAAEWCDGVLLCKELLIAPEGLEGALALVGQAAGAPRILLRRPAFWPGEGLEKRNFAMVKWYDPIAAKRWQGEGHFGLAFD